MKNIKFLITLLFFTSSFFSCKDQLDVKNPNSPTPASSGTENGILALAQGAVYASGFKDLKYYDGVSGYFWSGAIGYHELMGDVIGVEAANQYLNQLGCADNVTYDDGTSFQNPNNPKSQVELIRQINVNANQGNNPLYFEWAYMYNLNNGCNSVLDIVETVKFSGDDATATTKKNTIKAWAYWWKGFAYARIGSIYYAGLIINKTGITNGNYVTKDEIIAESNANFDKAATLLSSLSNDAAYQLILGKVIPGFCQIGKGGIIPPDAWKRSINTMKARNILVNTPVKSMTSAQYNSILTLVNDGVKQSDLVFTGRSNENGDFLSATSGTVAARATGSPSAVGFKISERLIQDFKAGDKRLENNFEKAAATWVGNSDRGNIFNTRYGMIDGGKGLPGVVVLGSRTVGGYELYLAATYEENELMKAEAKIKTGDTEGGLAIIDAIRSLQGAGLPSVAGTGLNATQAYEELRSERRVVLPFRGLSFYDARRWGLIDKVSSGGGRKDAVVINKTGTTVFAKSTIDYGFLDYWDVPDNELVYNPPSSTSVTTKNPK